jgi:hypothetical protein
MAPANGNGNGNAFVNMYQLAGDRFGKFDIPCPWCGPERRSPANRLRKVLRVWRTEADFATYCCARCGETGCARDSTAPRRSIAPEALRRAKAEAEEFDRASAAERLGRARRLWARRKPLAGTIAERYLRHAAMAARCRQRSGFCRRGANTLPQ